MSWEAVTWANKQRLKKSYEQVVLLVLANCADPNGEAFAKWPGREHWWIYLSDKTRLPKSSLFRHLNTIMALGLGERAMQVLADGSRRPTFKLNMEASFDIESPEDQQRYDAVVSKGSSENQSPIETEPGETFVGDENDSDISHSQGEKMPDGSQSPVETGISQAQSPGETDPFPVLRPQEDSKKVSKDSPLPPSGGVSASASLWEEFLKAWGEPIPKLALAKQAFDHVESTKCAEAVAAAKGYFAWLKRHPKPPATISAQAFLRDAAGWAQWLRYVPSTEGGATLVPSIPVFEPTSREGTAIRAVYSLACGFLRERPGGRVEYPGEITPQLLAFADVADRLRGHWTENRNQIGAWFNFFEKYVIGNRNVTTTTRGIGADMRRGMWVPEPWPPRADGTWSATGPPDMLLAPGESQEDAADFK